MTYLRSVPGSASHNFLQVPLRPPMVFLFDPTLCEQVTLWLKSKSFSSTDCISLRPKYLKPGLSRNWPSTCQTRFWLAQLCPGMWKSINQSFTRHRNRAQSSPSSDENAKPARSPWFARLSEGGVAPVSIKGDFFTFVLSQYFIGVSLSIRSFTAKIFLKKYL